MEGQEQVNENKPWIPRPRKQVRHCDQPWYHKQWIGVFVGTCPILASGAPCSNTIQANLWKKWVSVAKSVFKRSHVNQRRRVHHLQFLSSCVQIKGEENRTENWKVECVLQNQVTEQSVLPWCYQIYQVSCATLGHRNRVQQRCNVVQHHAPDVGRTLQIKHIQILSSNFVNLRGWYTCLPIRSDAMFGIAAKDGKLVILKAKSRSSSPSSTCKRIVKPRC